MTVLLVMMIVGLLLVLLFREKSHRETLRASRVIEQAVRQEIAETQQQMTEQEISFQKRQQIDMCDVRDLYLIRCLDGRYFHTEEELLQDGKLVNVMFPNPLYLVLIGQLETWGDLFQKSREDQKEIYFILRNVLENSFSGVTHGANISGAIVAVLNLEELPETGLRGIVQDARRSLEVLEEEFGITVTVAISRVYHSPLALHEAYEDARRVLEYRRMLDEDYPITIYEELTYPYIGAPSGNYLKAEQQLLTAILNGNLAEVRMSLHEMMSMSFGMDEASIDTIRFRMYSIANILLYLADHLREYVGNEGIDKLNWGPRVTSADSLGEIASIVDDLLSILDCHLSVRPSGSWLEAIPQYIEEHYRDQNLNVSSVADYFGLNVSYCSKVYKEHYGHRLYDRIQSRRLHAAKALLRTDKNIDQIAEEVGFSSALTMSRAFKKNEGTTPGKYREEIVK